MTDPSTPPDFAQAQDAVDGASFIHLPDPQALAAYRDAHPDTRTEKEI